MSWEVERNSRTKVVRLAFHNIIDSRPLQMSVSYAVPQTAELDQDGVIPGMRIGGFQQGLAIAIEELRCGKYGAQIATLTSKIESRSFPRPPPIFLSLPRLKTAIRIIGLQSNDIGKHLAKFPVCESPKQYSKGVSALKCFVCHFSLIGSESPVGCLLKAFLISVQVRISAQTE